MLTRRIEPIAVPSGARMPAAQPKEDGGVGDIAHRDVGDRDVLDVRAVHGFQREPARAVEDDVGDRDIAEIAFGFGADFDAPGGAVAVGRLFDGPFVSAVQQ